MKNLTLTAVALATIQLLAACRAVPADDPPGDPNRSYQLLQADRDFCATTAARGIDGWTSFFAAEGVRLELGGKFARGPAEIAERDAPAFADPATRLVWEPATAHVFAGGELGFTTGPYRLVRIGADGRETALATGRYFSLWRRENGRWKVLLDTGALDPVPDKNRLGCGGRE
ncbi:MAG: nuclear transport factor 2 family protein [Planctomycetota bacterium]